MKSRRLEEAFNPVEGVKTITSVSLEGVSQVVVEFELGRDVDVAAQDLRAKIEGIRRNLPTAIDPPVLQKLDPASEPIMSLALRSETTPIVELTTLADLDIRKRLESVRGVGEVRLAGGLKREVRVYIDRARMQSLGVSMEDVRKALKAQNIESPAGRGDAVSERLESHHDHRVGIAGFRRLVVRIDERAGLHAQCAHVDGAVAFHRHSH
ncbi:MAG: efflux RND transporter permease subunit [Phycisphaerae bacterium]|nr:efflux RND transporter permease subunit [Gemmatimonadaceae bacterium]